MVKDEDDAVQEEVTPEPKSASPWLPVLAIIILMPVVSFGMTQFVLLPMIKTSVGSVEEKAPVAHAESKSKSHGSPKVEEKKDVENGFTYPFENVVVNLAGSMGTKYLKTTFSVFSVNPDLPKLMDDNKNKLFDVALSVLSSQTITDLEGPGSRNKVRNDLIVSLNQALKTDIIEQIYFSEFVVQ